MVNARECDVVMHSVASVCLSVRVSVFESLDLETYWCAGISTEHLDQVCMLRS